MIPRKNDGVKPLTGEDVLRRLNSTIEKNKKNVELLVEELNKTNNSVDNYVKAISKDIGDLQDQVDGNITTWFYPNIPTLENVPASDWTNENDKIKHIGDLYYDQDTGYAYRFNYNNSTKEFYWKKITDSDVTEALAVANSAKDTADRKRQNFVDTPYTPYDVGDFWIKDNKDLYRCQTKRTEGDFVFSDWIKATDYSNDDYAKQVESVLSDFKKTVETDYVTNVKFNTTKDTLESSVETITTQVTTISSKVDDTVKTISKQYRVKGTSEWLDTLPERKNGEIIEAREVYKHTNDVITYGTAYDLTGDKGDTGDKGNDATIKSATAPTDTSQLWYDTTENVLKSYDGTNWIVVNDYSSDINEVDNKVGVLSGTISQNKTETENALNDVNQKFNDYVTKEIITSITQKVEETITATSKNTEIITKIEEDGVTKVDTKTGFKFDSDGFSIDKSDAPTSSLTNEKGLKLKDKSNGDVIQYTGYVDNEISNDVALLKDFLGQTVSYSKSLIFNQFLRSKNFRIEEIEDSTHGKGLGIFYVGGDS